MNWRTKAKLDAFHHLSIGVEAVATALGQSTYLIPLAMQCN